MVKAGTAQSERLNDYELCAHGTTEDGVRIEKHFRAISCTEGMGYITEVHYLYLNTATGKVTNSGPQARAIKKVWEPELTMTGKHGPIVLSARWNTKTTWKNNIKYTKVLCDCGFCDNGQGVDRCCEAWGENEG